MTLSIAPKFAVSQVSRTVSAGMLQHDRAGMAHALCLQHIQAGDIIVVAQSRPDIPVE